MPRVAACLALLVLLTPKASALLARENEFEMDADEMTEEVELFREGIDAVLQARFTKEQLQQMEAESWEQTEELVNIQTLAAAEGEDDPVSEEWNKVLVEHSPPRWFHCPKCGSSFINLLMHIPGLCPDVPPGFHLSMNTMGLHFLARFTIELGFAKHCPPLGQFGGHVGFDRNQTYYEANIKGKAMGMFREPATRLVSAFKDGLQAHRGKIVKSPTSSWAWQEEEPTSDINVYANHTKGCVAKMLTRKGFACGGPPLDAEEAKLAVERVNDFAFVGLQEEWPLSICLWHKMFGGKCRAYEMMNARPSYERNAKKLLKKIKVPIFGKKRGPELDPSFKDPYDGAVYEAAKARFWNDAALFNISDETCAPCIKEADNDRDVVYKLDGDGSAEGAAQSPAAKWRHGFTKSFAAWLDNVPAAPRLPRGPTKYAKKMLKGFGLR